MKHLIKLIFFVIIFSLLCPLTKAQSKKEQIEYLQNKVDSLKGVVFQYKKSSLHFSEVADSIISRNSDLHGEIEKLANDKKLNKELLNRAEKSIIEKENQIKILNNKIENLANENQALSNKIMALEKQIESNKNQRISPKDYNLPMTKIGLIGELPLFLDNVNEQYYILFNELEFNLPNYGNFTLYYFSDGSCTDLIDHKIKVVCRVLILDNKNTVRYDKIFDPSPYANEFFGQVQPELYQFDLTTKKVFLSTISTGCGSDHQKIFCLLEYNGKNFSIERIAKFAGGYSFIEFDGNLGVFYFLTRVQPPCHYDCYSLYEVSIYSIENIQLLSRNTTKYKYNDFNMMHSNLELINEIKQKEPKLFEF